jgi:Extensin-like protein C-terminus
MSRGFSWFLFGTVVVAALIVLAGCSHYFNIGEREAWRHDAEVACLNSGAVKEGPERVRISAINGPGICGADFPIRISALGESGPLGYDDEPLRPPGAIPDPTVPQHWPLTHSNAPPAAPPQYGAPQYGRSQYGSAQFGPPLPVPVDAAPSPTGPVAAGAAQATAQPGAPMSLYAPGVPQPEEDDAAFQPEPPRPYGSVGSRSNAPPVATYPPSYPPPNYPPTYTPRAQPELPGAEDHVPLGWPQAPVTAAAPVEIRPAATLACPIVSALDQWITAAVQPAAMHWFHQPVVEIKQISAYSCRGMNGDPTAHISEHAFGNALDIAEFALADGHRISVQYGWRGTPEEQGFLHDVQLAACDQFTTVLAPGANIYHYNHIHVDLMRRSSGRRICEPAAIPGEVVAERARARYAAQHYGDPGTTGSINAKPSPPRRVLGYSGEDDDNLPLAVPGND